MNCSEAMDVLPAYLTGELEPANAQALEAHLQDCTACARETEQQKSLDLRLQAAVQSENTDVTGILLRVKQHILAEAAAQVQSGSRALLPRRWIGVALGAAAAVLVAVLAYNVLLGQRTARVYADAAEDHRDEVTLAQPRHWRTDLAEIQSLAEKRGVPATAVDALNGSGYRLERGRICQLETHLYLHLVVTDGTREYSLFLRSTDGSSLPGSTREIVNGRAVHAAHDASEQVAGFESKQLLAIVVTENSLEAAMRLARAAANAL